MPRGIQDNPGVEAQLKHYVANEQEIDRNSSSSNVDLQTLHEIYTLPFQIAVEEGDPGSVMCAFNQVNHVYSCENATILGDILKSEIGFEGWVVTDFGAIHSLNSTPPSLVAGLDQELNRPRFWNPTLLHAALDAGTITEADIDEAAFRVVRAHIEHGLFDVPRLTAPRPRTNEAEHEALARQIAEEGSVLLKNDGLLPLSGTGQTIAVIGPTASSTPTGGISAASVCGTTAPNVPCSPTAPLDSITARAAADGNTVVFDNGADLAAAAATAGDADVAIVFGYYRSGEFNDRANISLDGNGDALISAVAAANANTIVVLQTGGPVLMPWLADVEGVLEVWYAGQKMGPAIASLLWGDVNPSGKLTHTFPVTEAGPADRGELQAVPGLVHPDRDHDAAQPAGRRHPPGRVHRRVVRRLPLVRRGGHRPPVPVRLRAVVHVLRVLESVAQEDRRRRRQRVLHGDEHRRPCGQRGSAGLPGAVPDSPGLRPAGREQARRLQADRARTRPVAEGPDPHHPPVTVVLVDRRGGVGRRDREPQRFGRLVLP